MIFVRLVMDVLQSHWSVTETSGTHMSAVTVLLDAFLLFDFQMDFVDANTSADLDTVIVIISTVTLFVI